MKKTGSLNSSMSTNFKCYYRRHHSGWDHQLSQVHLGFKRTDIVGWSIIDSSLGFDSHGTDTSILPWLGGYNETQFAASGVLITD